MATRPYAVHWHPDPDNRRAVCGAPVAYVAHTTDDVGLVDCQRCLTNRGGNEADTCGAGTPYGCRQPIGAREDTHLIVNARIRPGDSSHVSYHVGRGCCPCEVVPELVEPAWSKGFAAELAKANA